MYKKADGGSCHRIILFLFAKGYKWPVLLSSVFVTRLWAPNDTFVERIFVMINSLLNMPFLRHKHFILIYFYHLWFYTQSSLKKVHTLKVQVQLIEVQVPVKSSIEVPVKSTNSTKVPVKSIPSPKVEIDVWNKDIQIFSVSTTGKPPPVINNSCSVHNTKLLAMEIVNNILLCSRSPGWFYCMYMLWWCFY